MRPNFKIGFSHQKVHGRSESCGGVTTTKDDDVRYDSIGAGDLANSFFVFSFIILDPYEKFNIEGQRKWTKPSTSGLDDLCRLVFLIVTDLQICWLFYSLDKYCCNSGSVYNITQPGMGEGGRLLLFE